MKNGRGKGEDMKDRFEERTKGRAEESGKEGARDRMEGRGKEKAGGRVLADYHVHTVFSDDSETPMEDAVLHAIAVGLQEICFTEHIDYGVKTDLNCDCDAYMREVRRCQELYGDRIKIGLGMEFGMQAHTIGQFQETFDKYPFDFIILSCHQVEDKEFWTYEFQNGKSQGEYNRRYYQEILNVAENYDDYSVLGHLDMIHRYDRAGIYPFEKVKDLVEEILRRVIAGGKGIEVNTSCYRYKLPDLTPSREILRLYRHLGGEIITIGSDAHTIPWIGWETSRTQQELKELGFTSIYTFDKMKPVRHEL